MNSEHAKSPEDAHKIVNINEAWLLRYWTRELGITERDLRETVEAVGPMLADVKRIRTR
jgi:hypothetical protein